LLNPWLVAVGVLWPAATDYAINLIEIVGQLLAKVDSNDKQAVAIFKKTLPKSVRSC
jgi:hypothetical protein